MFDKRKTAIGIQKTKDFYDVKPDAPVFQAQSWFTSLDNWKSQGFLSQNADDEELAEVFGFDAPGIYDMGNLGHSDPPYCPLFEEKLLEDQGDYDIVQDEYGKHLKLFKSHGNDFMPEYLAHPVTDMKSWEEKCLWRLDPSNPERDEGINKSIEEAKIAAAEGKIISAGMIGGFMYLRSLMGTMNLLYSFYDQPELIHKCMEVWLNLNDEVCERFQKEVVIDEVNIGEDISYKNGSLISGGMIHEFLFPYYQQLLANIKSRNIDKNRILHFAVDTDGFTDEVIPIYREIGMDFLYPVEVAAGGDVIDIGRQYPDLKLRGGFDKRILAKSKESIDKEVDRIMPVMKKRGGFIPDCDHLVPLDVSFENYLHYRKRIQEFG